MEKYSLEWYEKHYSLMSSEKCPLCGRCPKYDVYKEKLEHICKTPRGSWYAFGSQHLTMPRWNDHCQRVTSNLREEAGQA